MKIYNGKVITMEGQDYEPGYVAFENGKITAVGHMKDMPAVEAGDLDAAGGYVIPGFIDGHCHSGGYIWDLSETFDPVTPYVDIVDSTNTTDLDFIGVVRSGVTAGVVCPGSSNLVGGYTALVKFGKRTTIDEALVKSPCSMKAAFGENPTGEYGRDRGQSPASRMGNAAMLRDLFAKSKRYIAKKEAGEVTEPDQKLEAMIPIMTRKIAMHIHAHRSDDIMSAIRVCKEFDVRCVVVHGTGGHVVADCIAESGVPVIAGPILFPNCKPEMAEGYAENVVKMYKAGVDLCYGTDAWVIRGDDLPASAAVSISLGLPELEALKMLTINTARICDADDRIGSLKVGKDADIVVFDEFPLSYTAHVVATFSDGNCVYAMEE